MSAKKLETSLENFRKTVDALRAALALPVTTDRDRSGIVKSFEFTYELSWKTLKRFLEDEGHVVDTARETFRQAFALHLIGDEHSWLRMIADRNATAHTYNQAFAAEIVGRIAAEYGPLFEKLLSDLRGRIRDA